MHSQKLLNFHTVIAILALLENFLGNFCLFFAFNYAISSPNMKLFRRHICDNGTIHFIEYTFYCKE